MYIIYNFLRFSEDVLMSTFHIAQITNKEKYTRNRSQKIEEYTANTKDTKFKIFYY